jgi:hypothetical protein
MEMRLRTRSRLIGSAALLLLTPAPALAWGSEGHQYVGNVGWALLNPSARSHVKALLGPTVTLADAAVWPDCVRSVSGSPSTGYTYHGDQYTPQACAVFGNDPAEVQRMTDYASRNWTNCNYAGHATKCNLSYHFADVNVHEHSDYQPTYFGTEPNDVVHAIRAAVIVLGCKTGQTCAVPPPFDIVDKREALFLLAHFIGDVHQPLHVGAAYLDGAGAETGDSGQSTIGGNILLLSPGNTRNNLHHSWDQIPSSLNATPSNDAIASACKIAPLPNPTAEPPENWASESVLAAKDAYSNMSFTPDASVPADWDVQFENKPAYSAARRSMQIQRLVSGGARLAATLNSIWPSTRKAAACRKVHH